jgi:hypothetical protein
MYGGDEQRRTHLKQLRSQAVHSLRDAHDFLVAQRTQPRQRANGTVKLALKALDQVI